MKKKPDLSELATAWGCPFVPRNKIEEFSGGMVTAQSMAVFDSQGRGVENGVIINRKMTYHVKDVVTWLESRVGR